MRAHEGPGGPGSPTTAGFSVSTVLEVADGLRQLDPHLSAELARHAMRLAGEDGAMRGAAEGVATRALGELDRGTEVVDRAASLFRAALEQGWADEAAVLRCELAGAALQCDVTDLAAALLAPLPDVDALPVALRPEVALRLAQVRAAEGDVAGTDEAVDRTRALRSSGTVRPLLEIDLQRARATARSVQGDAAAAASILASIADDAPGSVGLDGGRRATVLAADHIAALLDAGDLASAHDRAAPFLLVRSTAPTALALGRLRVAVAGRVYLPGAPDDAEALARASERDLLDCAHNREAGAAARVLADTAEARGDLSGALVALRRAHVHDLRAHDERRRAERLLAEVVEFADGSSRPTASTATATASGSELGEDGWAPGPGPTRPPAGSSSSESSAGAVRAPRGDSRTTGDATASESSGRGDGVDHDAVLAQVFGKAAVVPDPVPTGASGPSEGRRAHRRREDAPAPPVAGPAEDLTPRHGRGPRAGATPTSPSAGAREERDGTRLGVRGSGRPAASVDAFSTAPQGERTPDGRSGTTASQLETATTRDHDLGRQNGAPVVEKDSRGPGTGTDRNAATSTAAPAPQPAAAPDAAITLDTEQVVIAGAAHPVPPVVRTPRAGDEADELPLTLTGLLAEYDLPEVRGPAPSAAHGGEGPPRWAAEDRGARAGPSSSAATASLPVPLATSPQQSPDSGARLADLLAEAMDAFRRSGPGGAEVSPPASGGHGTPPGERLPG